MRKKQRVLRPPIRHNSGGRSPVDHVVMNGFARLIVGLSLLAVMASSAFARAVLRPPNGAEARATGRVVAVDVPRRTVTISVDSLLQPGARELVFGRPETRVLSLPPTSHIHFGNNAQRWLRMRELTPGANIAAYVTQGGESWRAHQILIDAADPLQPAEPGFPSLALDIAEDRVTSTVVTVPMIFPMLGGARWSDTFLAPRGGGSRRHRGQDLMAPKMRPMLACFSGTVTYALDRGISGHIITLRGDNGWVAQYYHVNNDTPGTDDGLGGMRFALAPGLTNGSRVVAGQFIGWNGDSGNAEGTAPHLHFELWYDGVCYNPAASLRAAQIIANPVLMLPMPDWVPPRGEVRVDGIVAGVDRDRNVVVLDVTAELRTGRDPQAALDGRRRFLRVEQASRITSQLGGQPLQLDQLATGARLTAFIPETPAHEGARLIAATLEGDGSGRASLLAAEPQTPIIIPTTGTFTTERGQTLLEELNRARRGQTALTFAPQACAAADDFALRMATGDFLGGRDPRSGLTLSGEIQATGFTGSMEVVIVTGRNPAGVVSNLQNLFPEVISDPNWSQVAVGYAYLDEDGGRVRQQHYWVLVFLRP